MIISRAAWLRQSVQNRLAISGELLSLFHRKPSSQLNLRLFVDVNAAGSNQALATLPILRCGAAYACDQDAAVIEAKRRVDGALH